MDALRAACGNLGLNLVKQDSFHWFQGHSACDYAIQIPGDKTAHEIGVKAREDGQPGYDLLWDDFEPKLRNAVGAGANKLKQRYSSAVARRYYAKRGYRVTERMKEDGSLILEATKS